MPSRPARPKNYFLNESHELSIEEKGGGGRHVEYPNINWPQKAQRLQTTLARVAHRARESRDPLSQRRFYLIADPTAQIVKASKAKDAEHGQKLESVVFRGEQSKYFERVGLDLIEVHPTGVATVHATPERMEQLITKTGELPQLGACEQARFVAFEAFEWLSGKWKFDREWLDEIGQKSAEGYIKLQPLISEIEADVVIRALEQAFHGLQNVTLLGKGRSYLGRFYLRAKLTAVAIKKIAEEFTSIQSIHPRLPDKLHCQKTHGLGDAKSLCLKGKSSIQRSHPSPLATRENTVCLNLVHPILRPTLLDARSSSLKRCPNPVRLKTSA